MKNIIFLVFLSFFLLSCDEDKPAKDAPIPKIAWMEVSVTGVEQSRRLSGKSLLTTERLTISPLGL